MSENQELITLHSVLAENVQLKAENERLKAQVNVMRDALEILSHKEYYGWSSYDGMAQIYDGKKYLGFPYVIARAALENEK